MCSFVARLSREERALFFEASHQDADEQRGGATPLRERVPEENDGRPDKHERPPRVTWSLRLLASSQRVLRCVPEGANKWPR